MRNIWNEICRIMKRNSGMTLVEILVSVAVLAVFSTAIVGSAVAANISSKNADVASYFDKKNYMAIAEFKTNPDPDYLKTVQPFSEMDYSEASKSFSKHYDKNFAPTNASDAPYFVTYQFLAKESDSSFAIAENEVVMHIFNQKRNAAGTGYEEIKTSSAEGGGMIHTLNMTNASINPTPPSVPETNHFRVSFVVEGGKFVDEDRNKRTIVVESGTPLKDILPSEGDMKATSTLPTEFTGWKKTGTTEIIPADTAMLVNTDLSISGTFQGIPCTVNFRIPYYAGSWSINPAGETASYVSQMGEKIDGDGLALLFGRSSYDDLFTGGVNFEGWFDDAGNRFYVASGDTSGTVLDSQWDGKVITARVSIPSVTVRLRVTEGEATGIYPVTIPIGSKISQGEIEAATGKNYSKIQNVGNKVLAGWSCADGSVFEPGITVLTADWNDREIVTQYQTAPNTTITVSAEITDRVFWDITKSNYSFMDTGGELKLRIEENTSKANTPPFITESNTYSLIGGNLNAIKNQIENVNGDLEVDLYVLYRYVNVKKYLAENGERELYFNGAADQSAKAKYDGMGAEFNLDASAAAYLKEKLGVKGNVVVRATFTAKEEKVEPSNLIWQRVANAIRVNMDGVSPVGRKKDEWYQLKITKQDNTATDGTPLYTFGMIGENGDNILDQNDAMDWRLFVGQTSNDPNGWHGNKNLPIKERTKVEIKEIDTFYLVIKRTGGGFFTQFAVEDGGTDSGYSNSYTTMLNPVGSPLCYYAVRTFTKPKMAPGSTVKVNKLVVYMPLGGFDKRKPTGKGNGGRFELYGCHQTTYCTAEEGWMSDDSWAGVRNLSNGTIRQVERGGTISLPNNFAIH